MLRALNQRDARRGARERVAHEVEERSKLIHCRRLQEGGRERERDRERQRQREREGWSDGPSKKRETERGLS